MDSQYDEQDISGAPEPAPVSVGCSSVTDIKPSEVHTQQASIQTQPSKELEFPAVKTILSALIGPAQSAPERVPLSLQPEEQLEMFRALQDVLLKAEENEGTFGVHELLSSLEQAEVDSQGGQRNRNSLQAVSSTLDKLWQSRSQYMVQAAQALADASRDREIYCTAP
jgi:hypothetical protein